MIDKKSEVIIIEDMNNEQDYQNALQCELERILIRYSREFDLSISSVVGVLITLVMNIYFSSSGKTPEV